MIARNVWPMPSMLASSRILLLVNSTIRMSLLETTETGGACSDMSAVLLKRLVNRERLARREARATFDSKGHGNGCQASPLAATARWRSDGIVGNFGERRRFQSTP